MDPGQTLIWVHTVCHRGFLNISADEKSRRLFAVEVLRVKRILRVGLTQYSFIVNCLFSVIM